MESGWLTVHPARLRKHFKLRLLNSKGNYTHMNRQDDLKLKRNLEECWKKHKLSKFSAKILLNVFRVI